MSGSDVALVCVGTPSRDNGELDISAIRRAAEGIGGAFRQHRKAFTVVLRSTVLTGTTDAVLLPALLGSEPPSSTADLSIAVNPEFMRQGSSLQDFAQPPLTLVGTDSPQTAALMRELYAGVAAPFVHTSVRTAEMAKYVSSAFHVLKVAFANEIGELCEGPWAPMPRTR